LRREHLESLLVEWHFRHRQGEDPSVEEHLIEYPFGQLFSLGSFPAVGEVVSIFSERFNSLDPSGTRQLNRLALLFLFL
jgi:hypothetical protein